MTPRQCCSAIVLIASLLPGAQAANGLVSGSRVLLLGQHTPAAVNKMATQITEKVGLGYHGYVHLNWSDDAWTSSALALRQSLLAKGFSSKQILLWHDIPRKKMLGTDYGLRITLLSIDPQQPKCPSHAMDYRYRKSDDMTCAIDQLRAASLLNDSADIF